MAIEGLEHLDNLPTADVSGATDQLFFTKQLERGYNSLPVKMRSPVDGAQDPQALAMMHRYGLGKEASATTFQIGRVVFSFPQLNCCRVIFSVIDAERWCVPLMASAGTPLSVIDVAMPAVDSTVLVAFVGESQFGFIVGILPSRTVDTAVSIGDYLQQGTSVGVAKEQTFRAVVENCLREAGANDFSANRPLDQTAAMWAKLSPLGGGVIVDLMMTALRIDEQCGVWFNYLHKLGRLAAYNFDLRTSGSEEYLRNDRNEIASMLGCTPYSWEALGILDSTKTGTTKRNNAGTVQTEGAQADREPDPAGAIPFWRYREYGGYLGQGRMREIVLPPTATERNLVTGDGIEIGVFREQIGLDGSYALISAKNMAYLKRTAISVPRRVRVPEDPLGDTAENYRAAGLGSNGDPHEVGTDPADLTDFVARTLNWKALHPFHYHADDFQLPDTAELPQRAAITPQFSQLKTVDKLEPPEPTTAKVDHRQTSADYYETVSGWVVRDNGNLHVIGPQGETVELGGGNIIFDCPGDVQIRAGRSLVVMAGDDIVLRANNSVDITSSNKDVRVKAEGNLEMVAGCGGLGRLLLENRSTEPTQDYPATAVGEDLHGSGIILRASHSALLAYTAGVYLRTGGDDSGIDGGNIIFDAGKGNNDVVLIANAMKSRLNDEASFSFPATGEDTRATHVLGADEVVLARALAVADKLTIADGGLDVQGEIRVKGGHITTEHAGDSQYDGRVGSFPAGSAELQLLGSDLLQAADDAAAATTAADTYYTKVIAPLYDTADITALGGKALITAMAFSFRDEAQYGTSNLQLKESRWQQLARMTQDTVERWTERAVTYRERELMPWPGFDAWAENPTFVKSDLQLFDPKTGRDVARASGKYENPPDAVETPAIPQGEYMIVPRT